MSPVVVRRAALLGVAMVVTGCDLITLATNPAPSFEQTWNLPASSQEISVADLLPAGNTVTIVQPDSLEFSLKVDSTNITRVVGADCPACVLKNGTNDFKPNFTLLTTSSTNLPADVVSAVITGGMLSVRLVNNMSFDPLYVNTNPAATVQGHMVITVRSGSEVLAIDSVRGSAAVSGTQNAPFPKNGGVLVRPIPFLTGIVTNGIQVEVKVVSPQGDHLEFINSNGTLNAVASVPNITVSSVDMRVTNRTMNSGTDEEIDLGDAKSDAIEEGRLIMDIVNPFTTVAGSLTVKFQYGPLASDTVLRSFVLPAGDGQASVTFDKTAMQKILADGVIMNVSGSVNSVPPIRVTPKQKMTISNRLVLKIRTSTGE